MTLAKKQNAEIGLGDGAREFMPITRIIPDASSFSRRTMVHTAMHTILQIQTKRIYEKPARGDGTRVLVDRLWPRGITKEDSALHAWLRPLAPSNELRKWFHQHPDSWAVFRKRYLKELSNPDALDALNQIYQLSSRKRRLTLLFASKDEQHNNAVALKELLEGMRKPPTGTGPVRYARQRQAKQLRG